jgi:hypothetical protein
MDKKVCNCCNIEKDISEFYTSKQKYKDKFYKKVNPQCKICAKNRASEYYNNNREKGLKARREYYNKNRDYFVGLNRKNWQENKDKLNKERNEKRADPILGQKIREIANTRRDYRYKNDPIFKIRTLVRIRMNKAIKGFTKASKSQEIIGCSWEELKIHLEAKFTDGMNWDNHTTNGWHIDHIIPLSSAKTLEEVEKLCHFTNLQPLWAEDNILKGDSF